MDFYIAAYGALLSTLLLGWTIYRDFDDRGRLKVTITTVRMHPPQEEDDPWYLNVNAVNIGKRVVNIKKIIGEFSDGKKFMFGPLQPPFHNAPIPHLLKEGEAIDYLYKETVLVEKKLKYICVIDATGKKWKANLKNRRQLTKELNDLKQDEVKE